MPAKHTPDLSPIDQLWNQLGRRVFDDRQRTHSCQQLIQALTREREAVPNAKFNV